MPSSRLHFFLRSWRVPIRRHEAPDQLPGNLPNLDGSSSLLVGGQIFLQRIELLDHKSYRLSNRRYSVEFVYVTVDDASMMPR